MATVSVKRSIGHFPAAASLCFKARLRPKLLIWKWFFILIQIKLIFTRKVLLLAWFWKWEFLPLGSGILSLCGIQSEKRLKKSCNEEHRGYVSQGLENFPLELKWRRTQRILSTRKYSCNWRKVNKNWHEKSMRLINK